MVRVVKTRKDMVELLQYLKDSADSVYENEDSIFEDYRSLAEYNKNEIVEILINLEIEDED